MSMITEQVEELREEADFIIETLDMQYPTTIGVAKIMKRAADTIEQLAAKVRAENGGEWIPTAERLPEIGEDVLVFAKCYFDCGCFEENTARLSEVFPKLCDGKNNNYVLDFGCKHGYCGECDMENTGHDDEMFFTHMVVASRQNEYDWEDLSDDDYIVAWMPLPKPYREDGETE